MLRALRTLTDRLITQDRAVCNARGAATELSRQRVERDDVELFLARLARPATGSAALPLARPSREARG